MQHQFEGRARIIGVASRATIEQIEAFVADRFLEAVKIVQYAVSLC